MQVKKSNEVSTIRDSKSSLTVKFNSVQSLSWVQLCVTPRTAACQASLSSTNSPQATQTHVHWVSDAPNYLILCCPLLFPLSAFPSIRSFPMSQFFASVAKVLEFQLQHQSFQWIFRLDSFWIDLLADQRDSQESSPTPQFKSINSSVLIFLYSSTLTSIHDYWESQSFD